MSFITAVALFLKLERKVESSLREHQQVLMVNNVQNTPRQWAADNSAQDKTIQSMARYHFFFFETKSSCILFTSLLAPRRGGNTMLFVGANTKAVIQSYTVNVCICTLCMHFLCIMCIHVHEGTFDAYSKKVCTCAPAYVCKALAEDEERCYINGLCYYLTNLLIGCNF